MCAFAFDRLMSSTSSQKVYTPFHNYTTFWSRVQTAIRTSTSLPFTHSHTQAGGTRVRLTREPPTSQLGSTTNDRSHLIAGYLVVFCNPHAGELRSNPQTCTHLKNPPKTQPCLYDQMRSMFTIICRLVVLPMAGVEY